MKIKKLGALLVSVALCAGMAAPAFAYGGEPVEEVEQPVLTSTTDEEDVVTVTDEETGALTPEGNLTLVDDYHTDYSDGSGQQFITLVSKSGATFYLVIDRNAKGQQTVHFMNLVDEADLLSLMEEEEANAYLRENGAGVGFATYNKVTGEPLESGQISEKNLPPDGQNTIPAARNWYLFELSDDDRKAIQQESVKILENIPQAGIGRRRIWEPETLPKDIRLINSHYDDLYRIPDGGVIQVDYPDGRSFTARVEHLDDYHFDMGGLGNVFHICQFAEVMERNHADFYPEIQTQDEQAAWELGGKGYLAIQSCEDGWDYTIYHSDFSVMDGGQLDAPELTIQEAREQILEAHHMEKGRRLLQDYDAVMDKVAETEELSADHRPSTLEKLAALASDTSAPKSSARSAPEL